MRFAAKRRTAARLAVCTALWFAVSLCSCSYREAVSFWEGGASGRGLYALSRNAGKGSLPLNKTGKLEYEMVSSGAVPRDEEPYFVEISFYWDGMNADKGGTAVFSAGEFAWELPRDVSFLEGFGPEKRGGAGPKSPLLSYVVPLPGGFPDRFTVSWDAGNPVPEKNASLVVTRIGLVKPWYGFSVEDDAVRVSPFVFSRDNALVIDPPSDRSFGPGASFLHVRFNGPGTFTARGSVPESGDYFRIEGSALRETVIPPAFIGPGAFPLFVSGKTISAVELKPPRPGSSDAGKYNVSLEPDIPPLPVTADPGLVLAWPRESFRDDRYEVFRWEKFPSILIFDFADYGVQDRFLKRLAFFAEKAGFKGRLARDREIADLHGWNAHDYRSETLAAFFDLAAKSDFPLLSEERELEAMLLRDGIIRRETAGIVPGEGAIISISRESAEYLRYLFMAHEGFHGLYFIDADFRDFCRRRWEAFAPVPRAFILSYFEYQAYDTRDTDLVINEFMAHILQQPLSQVERYFGEVIAARIDASERRRHTLPPKDEARGSWPLLAEAFRIEAEAFSRYVNQRWGLAAGRVRSITVN